MKTNTAAIIAIIAIIVSGLVVISLNGQDAPEPVKIQVTGSTTCLPILEECALRYMAQYPDKSIFVSGGGSSAGIKAVHDGVADIGMASRDLKPEELNDVVVTTIAKDNIAIIVNPMNPINDITKDVIEQIYTGAVTNFNQLGGNDEEIMVVTREQGSGTRSTFEKLVMNEDITDSAITMSSNGIVRSTVAGSPVGIGYISAGYVDGTVKALNVDANIGRNLYLITNNNPSDEVQNFIAFVLSDAGQDVVNEVGFVKV